MSSGGAKLRLSRGARPFGPSVRAVYSELGRTSWSASVAQHLDPFRMPMASLAAPPRVCHPMPVIPLGLAPRGSPFQPTR